MEAGKKYFQSVLEHLYIGISNEKNGLIRLKPFDIESLLKEEKEKKEKKEEKQMALSQNAITLPRESLEGLLKIENSDAFKKSLLEILKKNTDMNELLKLGISSDELYNIPTLQEKDLSGEKLISFFDQIFTRLKNATGLLEAAKLIVSLKEALERVSDSICCMGVGRNQESMPFEYLVNLNENLDCILASENLEYIKSDMEKVYAQEKPRFQTLAGFYDEMKFAFQQEKEMEPKQKTSFSPLSINAKAMKSFLDASIIGQEEAKKVIISALITNQLAEKKEERTACLLVGPTGSGKTLLCETISQYLTIPIEIVDTTQLTVQGYVGRKLEDYLERLLVKTNGNLELAEKSIIVFDEIDKKGSEKDSDISGKGVLNMLLPFIQGTTYEVKYKGESVFFDTSHLTIFATGAFTNVLREKRKDKTNYHNGIGFNSNFSASKEPTYLSLSAEDFIRYGNMPDEIMGRFATIVPLEEQTPSSLKQILNCSALLAEKRKMEKLGVTLHWTEGYLDKVVEKALQLKTGARALKSIVETSTLNARWEVFINPGQYASILLNAHSVEDNWQCDLIDTNGDSHSLKPEPQETLEEKDTKIKQIQKQI